MENPAQHGPATKIIRKVLEDAREQERKDMESGVFRAGGSLEMAIANALHHAGYLKRTDIWLDEPPAKRDRICIGCSRSEGDGHEDWCPVVTGTLSSLPVKPVIETDELPG